MGSAAVSARGPEPRTLPARGSAQGRARERKRKKEKEWERERARKGEGGRGRERKRRERARAGGRGLGRPGGGHAAAYTQSRRRPRAYLPGNSWRRTRAPSWICSPPTSSKFPTFSRAGGVEAGALGWLRGVAQARLSRLAPPALPGPRGPAMPPPRRPARPPVAAAASRSPLRTRLLTKGQEPGPRGPPPPP